MNFPKIRYSENELTVVSSPGSLLEMQILRTHPEQLTSHRTLRTSVLAFVPSPQMCQSQNSSLMPITIPMEGEGKTWLKISAHYYPTKTNIESQKRRSVCKR